MVYLISIPIARFLNRKASHWFKTWLVRVTSFLGLYLISTFGLIPLLAVKTGRQALPVLETGHLRPLHFYTCLLNRHYVNPELRKTLLLASNKLYEQYSGATVNYLDAGFPFLNGFPLLPHLSHNNGKKVDIAFRYRDAKSGDPVNDAPSPWGYGICEEPRAEEVNTAAFCEMKGYRNYSFMRRLVSQRYKKDYRFDEQETRSLLVNLLSDQRVEAVFLEPHLKARMNLDHKKLKFQGCHSVRHDDHIHIQIK